MKNITDLNIKLEALADDLTQCRDDSLHLNHYKHLRESTSNLIKALLDFEHQLKILEMHSYK
jgi:hypothetical protein